MFKILVVEDDREPNKTVCSSLNHNGYAAIGCMKANEAYDALYENMFDLIVANIMKVEFNVESIIGKGSVFSVKIRRD